MHELNNTVVGLLRIGIFSSVFSEWIPSIIDGFLAEYPDVTIELQKGRYEEISAWVQQGRIDCGFITTHEADGIIFTALNDASMLILTSAAHPLIEECGGDSVTIDQVLRYPLILPVEGDDHDIRLMFKNHRNKMDIRYLFRDDKSILSMVERNHGVTVMPELALQGYKHTLRRMTMDPPFFRTIGIVSRPMDSLSVVTKTFIDWVESHKDELL